MRGDENKNIDAGSKVKAFRQDFPPDKAAIHTSYKLLDIAGVPAVEGRALVVLLGHENEPYNLLSEAYAIRALRPPVPGGKGMGKGNEKDPRDIEQAQTGATGRALFLMGYGEKPDDSSEYEETDWFVANGWASQEVHDDFMAEAKTAMRELPDGDKAVAKAEWDARNLKWPLSHEQFQAWVEFLVPLGRKAKTAAAKAEAERAETNRSIKGNSPVLQVKDAQAGAGETGDQAAKEPVSQPSLDDEVSSVGPDAPFFKAKT